MTKAKKASVTKTLVGYMVVKYIRKWNRRDGLPYKSYMYRKPPFAPQFSENRVRAFIFESKACASDYARLYGCKVVSLWRYV